MREYRQDKYSLTTDDKWRNKSDESYELWLSCFAIKTFDGEYRALDDMNVTIFCTTGEILDVCINSE